MAFLTNTQRAILANFLRAQSGDLAAIDAVFGVTGDGTGVMNYAEREKLKLLLRSQSNDSAALDTLFSVSGLTDEQSSLVLLRAALEGNGAALDALAVAPVAPYLGPVGGRTFLHTNTGAPGSPYMCRIFDFARDNISAIVVDFPNFASDTLTGGTLTVNAASVEYPAGTFTQLKFAGATAGTAGPGVALLTSDSVTLTTPIPKGAKFFIRWSWQNNVGIPFGLDASGNTQYIPGGDAIIQTATNMTMNGTMTDAGTGLSMWPAAIRAMTTRRTLAIVGDSRNVTGAGIADAKGEQGEIGRSLGQLYGHVNVALAGEAAASFLANHTNRALVANYATDIIYSYGINDVTIGTAAATMIATDASIAALFPGKNFVYCTMPPRTNSSDNWTTLAGQSSPGGSYVDAIRGAVNASRRGRARFLEIADPLEPFRDAGKWQVDGTPFKYTLDGTHESLAGNDLLLSLLALPP